MELVKKRKILQIFSNGSLNFCYNSFFSSKNSQFTFYEKDFKNGHFYVKKKKHSIVNDDENLLYRKKYVDIKN